MRLVGRRRLAAVLVLGGLATFWVAILVAAHVNPGYAHRRDYVSTLAARGAEHGWLGVAAVAAAAGAIALAGLLVQPLSRPAAMSITLAGVGFLVVAFTRLDCGNGAAGCGLGGRFAVSGTKEVTHWSATTLSTVLLIGGVAGTGLALVRLGRRLAGVATLVAAAVTAGAFLAMGGESPGGVQRIGILVATGWLAALAIATLAGSTRSGAGASAPASPPDADSPPGGPRDPRFHLTMLVVAAARQFVRHGFRREANSLAVATASNSPRLLAAHRTTSRAAPARAPAVFVTASPYTQATRESNSTPQHQRFPRWRSERYRQE